MDVSYTGLKGEELAFVNEYDAVLLDLNLPEKDGLDILKFLRSSNVTAPVIIVTARDEIEDRALGLDLGADDYLTKPFYMVEPRVRIQASIRRYYGKSSPVLSVGRLTVTPLARAASVQGQPVELLAKEFDILEYLAEKYPAVVSAEELGACLRRDV